MSAIQKHTFTICAALLILQGLNVVADGEIETVFRSVGGFFNIALEHPKESVSLVEWKFNTTVFAEYSPNSSFDLLPSQFSKRLKTDENKVGVTIQNLQLSDAGTYSVIASKPGGQFPTRTIQLHLQDPVTAVQIKEQQTWMTSTNSCEIVLKCEADGAENLSYRWSGFKDANGARLQFSLQPADGDVTLTCTASNKVSTKSTTHNLTCTTDHGVPVSENPKTTTRAENNKGTDKKKNMLIGLGAGAAFLLLIIGIALLYCCIYNKDAKPVAECPNTVYAEVTPGTKPSTPQRLQSVTNEMTVYETVDEVRVPSEMTVYAKVSFPANTKVKATSSPYQ